MCAHIIIIILVTLYAYMYVCTPNYNGHILCINGHTLVCNYNVTFYVCLIAHLYTIIIMVTFNVCTYHNYNGRHAHLPYNGHTLCACAY